MFLREERLAELREKFSEPKDFPICDKCRKTTKGKYVWKIGDYVVCEDCIDDFKEYMEEEY